MRCSHLAIAAFSLVTPSAFGAGTLVVHLVPRASTMTWGETMLIDIFADHSGVTGGMSIAGWKFDVVGSPNGTLAGDVNDAVFSNGVNNGIPSGADLLDFAGGQLPLGLGGGNTSAFLGTISYTDQFIELAYPVQLDITDCFAPTGALNVYTSPSGTQSRSGFVITGNNHLVVVDSTPFHVVFPAPGSLSILGFAGLAATRRRR